MTGTPTPPELGPIATPAGRRLDRPKSVNEVADLVTKIVFGACTIAIAAAGFMLNASVDDGNRRRELYTFLSDSPLQAATQQEIRKVGFLKKVCASYLSRVEDVGAAELCQALPEPSVSTVKKVSRETVGAAAELSRTGDAGGYLRSPQAAAQNDLVAASAPVAVAPDQRWFVVLATVPASRPDAARALRARIATLVPPDTLGGRAIGAYRTRISNSYAITLGDAMTKAEAVSLAARMRRIVPFDDAFAQPDRAWTACDERCLAGEGSG